MDLLLVVPALTLGVAPIVVSLWIDTFAVKFSAALAGLWSLLLLVLIAAIGWFGGRRLFRLVEEQLLVAELAGRPACLRDVPRGAEPAHGQTDAVGCAGGEAREGSLHDGRGLRDL